MARVRLPSKLMNKLAAQAVMHGHSVGAEINARLEASFTHERAEPKEWR